MTVLQDTTNNKKMVEKAMVGGDGSWRSMTKPRACTRGWDMVFLAQVPPIPSGQLTRRPLEDTMLCGADFIGSGTH